MLERGSGVLVAGVSARALAQSAARAGYRVMAVDAFGDVDLRAIADVVALRRDTRRAYSAVAAARAAHRAAEQFGARVAAYTSNFENYPAAIAQLAVGRRLLGNPPEVVARARQPVALMRTLRRLGFAVPTTRASAPSAVEARRWLLKPRASGGGHGTRPWRRGSAVRRSAYVQELIVGVPGSITFAADGRRAVSLGLSRQLVGDEAFGATGFRYCGSLVGTPGALFEQGNHVHEIAAALADTVTAEFGLVGLNGIDFIVRDGVPYPIEVNPRYSASMELIEQASAASMFEVHVRACEGELPRPARLSDMAGVYGKAIVFAPRAVRLGDTAVWLDGTHADVPHSGERIGRGRAICTVLGRAEDTSRCYETLATQAARVVAYACGSPAATRGAA